jgi:plastocyanin
MKKFLYIITFMLINLGMSFAATHIIVNSGSTFSPDNITINSGDTVDFQLTSTIHNAVEVSQSTWEANGTTKLSGWFEVPFGGGKVKLTEAGTHYYVCANHAFMGMKGIINVNTSAGVRSAAYLNKALFKISTNSAKGQINVLYSVKEKSDVHLSLIDITGNTLNDFVYTEQLPGDYNIFIERLLVAGTYIIRMSVNDRVYTRKILIM